MTLPFLASCYDGSQRGSENSAGFADRGGNIDIEFKGTFTAVANGVSMGDAVSVTVCEEYRDKLGEVVNVTMDGLSEMGIYGQCELKIEVDKIEASNDPPTVAASSVVIMKKADSSDLSAYYGYGPYKIPDISALSVPDDMPDFKDPSLDLETRNYKLFTYGALRVVEILDDIVYLANIYSSKATVVIIGIPDVPFAVGDHIDFDSSKHYVIKDNSRYDIVYAKEISNFRLPSDEEIAKAYRSAYAIDKPVIYLYPEEDTVCSVKVNLDGILTCTYPEHGENGWQNFTAKSDGTLIFPDGSEYYCLYWEGLANIDADFSEGFCVKASDTASFLKETLAEIGLTQREANEFIIYWLPFLQKNEYNIISFQYESYISVAELEINPVPDSLLRVYMVAKPVDSYVEITEQTFDGFERKGFTVVEWGGSIFE